MLCEVSVATVFAAVLFKAVWWGIGENRQFYDRGPAVQMGFLHFTSYHIWMLKKFGVLNAGFATSINYIMYVKGVIESIWVFLAAQAVLFAFLTIWDILILDVTWWVNRYVDVTHLGQKPWMLGPFVVWEFPAVNIYDNGTGKPWHSVSDWDAGGLPLWFGTYSWWWVLSFALVGLGWGYLHVLLL
jgi:hypothetical protein